jgi:hypothetical protein
VTFTLSAKVFLIGFPSSWEPRFSWFKLGLVWEIDFEFSRESCFSEGWARPLRVLVLLNILLLSLMNESLDIDLPRALLLGLAWLSPLV